MGIAIDSFKQSFEIAFKRTGEWLSLGLLPCLYVIVFLALLGGVTFLTVPKQDTPTPLIVIPIIFSIVGGLILWYLCAKVVGALSLYVQDVVAGNEIYDAKSYLEIYKRKNTSFIKLILFVFFVTILISVPIAIISFIPLVNLVAGIFGGVITYGLTLFTIFNYINMDIDAVQNIKISLNQIFKNILPLTGITILFQIVTSIIMIIILIAFAIIFGIVTTIKLPILTIIATIIGLWVIVPVIFLFSNQNLFMYALYYYKKKSE